jgi:pyruvate dehydrogenase E2 component (dihydrolipoamide acetyltransferase)
LLVSPRARRIAEARGIDLATVAGTGPGGSIVAVDLERGPTAAPGQAPSASPTPRQELPEQKRKTIASLMERSNREIPHYYLGRDINMEPALDWLAAENKRRSVADRLLYSALLLKATALAAHEVPEMNGYFIDGELRASPVVNLGVAISLRSGGLVAPAILDASVKSLSEVMRALMDLVKRSRSGKLRASEMSSSTITVTNLGELGVDYVHGVIYPPQVALVGFGRIEQRPWAANGMVGAKPILKATLAADHRASDGHRGGIFLSTVAHLLGEPEHL